MQDNCEHDIIMSRCSKCDNSVKVILLNTFSSAVLAECETSAVQIGTGLYVPMEKIRKLLRKWDA